MAVLLLSVILFMLSAPAVASEVPDAEQTCRMSRGQIENVARDLSVFELKQWADSVYYRTSMRHCPYAEVETIYKLLMLRGAGKLDSDEEKAMAAACSNYATFLIFERNNPVLAYPLLRRSLELMEKHKDEGLLIVGAFTNMAHIYANFNDTIKALDHLKKGFSYALQSNSPKRSGYIYAQLLLMAWEFDRLPEILPAMRRFQSAKELRGSPLYEYNRTLTKGVESYMEGDFEAAESLMREARRHIDAEYDPEVYTSMTLLMAADAALKANKNEIARNLIDSAAFHLSGYRELNGMEFLNRIKARYFRQTGMTAAARECEIRSLVLRDSLYNARNMTTISDLEQDRITSKFNTELRESQLHQQVLREKNVRQKMLIIVMGTASAIIITLLLFLLYKRRKLNECRYDLIMKDLEPEQAKDPHPRQVPDRDDPRLKEIFETIEKYMSESPEIYSTGFSIESLSAAVQIPEKQISRAINLHAGKNFSLFLGDYRIREACRILVNADPEHRPTIELVAEKVGYRSRSHFSRTFKAVTGLTTTDFLRHAQKHRP